MHIITWQIQDLSLKLFVTKAGICEIPALILDDVFNKGQLGINHYFEWHNYVSSKKLCKTLHYCQEVLYLFNRAHYPHAIFNYSCFMVVIYTPSVTVTASFIKFIAFLILNFAPLWPRNYL